MEVGREKALTEEEEDMVLGIGFAERMHRADFVHEHIPEAVRPRAAFEWAYCADRPRPRKGQSILVDDAAQGEAQDLIRLRKAMETGMKRRTVDWGDKATAMPNVDAD